MSNARKHTCRRHHFAIRHSLFDIRQSAPFGWVSNLVNGYHLAAQAG